MKESVIEMDDTEEDNVSNMSEQARQPKRSPKSLRKKRKKSPEKDVPTSSSDVSAENVRAASRMDVSAKFAQNMAEISAEMRALVLSEGVTKRMGKEVLDLVAKYEAVIVQQCSEIARLEGRLEERRATSTPQHPSPAVSAKAASSAALPVPISKPSPTYAIVVRAAGNDAASTDDLKKRVLDVGREMGPVKVKSVRTLKDGGVAVVASSLADVQKIRAAPQFAAAGLALTDPKMSEPRIIVNDVPNDVTNERLIGEVLPANLTGVAVAAELAQCKIVSRIARANESVNLILEMPKKLRDCLINEGRLYIGWNSCRVREYESVPQCYGCGSYAHLLARCPFGRLCHNCGEAGHAVGTCTAAAKCRNCSQRGLPADHRVTSVRCPCFVRESERWRSRVIG